MLTYQQRLHHLRNPCAVQLLTLMQHKQTNLCVAIDTTHAEELLELTHRLGPEICLLKTHIDIIEDFTPALTDRLRKLAQEHQFLIFEDRKFADIGNTVKLQYSQGLYQIANWAHITNAHTVPGPGIIDGLKQVGLEKGNALLLLAEMSSSGMLAKGDYTQATVEMAKQHSDFVIGFISQHQLLEDPQFLYFAPGIHLDAKKDALGQRYTTPHQAIADHGIDIMIVGRGIVRAPHPVDAAKDYREAGMDAYHAAIKA